MNYRSDKFASVVLWFSDLLTDSKHIDDDGLTFVKVHAEETRNERGIDEK